MNALVDAMEPRAEKPATRSAGPPPRPGELTGPVGAARFIYPSGARPLPGITIKRGVGHGGFGEVYYALTDGGKEVALKLIRRNLEVELRGVRHCLNLKHPHLLAIFDLRRDDQGDHWVVMEYVTGESLEEVLAAHPHGLPVDQALVWFHGMAAGVAYLHDHGVVHRDLKPANIFSDQGIVKVGDYGLSKFISCSRRSGHTESVGTVHYMAPEIANGRYGKEIDIYALGVILYEMLTGRVPFEGESVGEVLMKHLTTPPDVSMLSEPFRGVVARALEKDPARRFASVEQMVAGLPRPVQPELLTRTPFGDAGRGNAPTLPGQSASAGRSPGQWLTDEPIFRSLAGLWRKAVDAWNQSKNTPVKIGLLAAGLIVLLIFAHGLLPIALMALVFYAAYAMVRGILRVVFPRPAVPAAPPGPYGPAGSSPRRAPVSAPPFPPGPPPWRGPPGEAAPPVFDGLADQGSRRPHVPPGEAGRAFVGQPSREALVLKPWRHRLAGLLGSMLAAAPVVLVMTVVMVLVNGYRGLEPRLEQAAWLAMIGLVGTWAVLIPGKFWEGTSGDAMVRRFMQLVIGLAVGAGAYAAATGLQVALPLDGDFSPRSPLNAPTLFYGPGGQPHLMAFLAVFATLFAVIGWWRQCDPLRPARMGLWSIIVSVALAWLAAVIWRFPPTWLMMVACIMSVAIQLCSPWVPRDARRFLGKAPGASPFAGADAVKQPSQV